MFHVQVGNQSVVYTVSRRWLFCEIPFQLYIAMIIMMNYDNYDDYDNYDRILIDCDC